MEPKQFIEHFAESGEEFLITWRDHSADLLEDLKILVQLFPADEWESGQLVKYAVEKAIEEFGADGGATPEGIQDNFSNIEFDSLKDWTQRTFSDGDLLILDAILYRAMHSGVYEPYSQPQNQLGSDLSL